jgi:flagellar protein FliJ
MKKMMFRLEHVLRLREFEEKKAKLELGNVLGRINATNIEIEEARKQINTSDLEFRDFLTEPRKILEIRIFPFIMDELQKTINRKMHDLILLNKELEEKKISLKIAEGKLKVIEKLKEKQYEKFKKEIDKKYQNEIDDHTIMRYGEKS